MKKGMDLPHPLYCDIHMAVLSTPIQPSVAYLDILSIHATKLILQCSPDGGLEPLGFYHSRSIPGIPKTTY